MISMNTIPSERSICSTVMYNISIMESLIGKLQSDHFFDELCREVFDLAQTAYLTKSPFTDFYVISKIPTKEKEILEISVIQPVSKETLVMQADSIIRAFENRNMLHKIDEVKNAIMEGRDYSLDDLKSSTASPSARIRTNEDIINVMEDRINNPIQDHGIGLSEVDRYLNLEPGNLIVIAARPSMGKTGLTVTAIWHLLNKGEGSIFFSLEMPSEAIMMRMIANESGETLSAIRDGKLVDYNAYNGTKNKLKDSSNYVMIDESVDHVQIYNLGMSIVRKNPNIKNIFVDHLTYIKDPGGYQSTHIRIGEVTKTMKRLAKDAKIKVWLLSQLSRGIESRPNKRPQLSDMRESGSIEEDADVIMGIYRESYYTSREEATRENPINDVEILILKNRDGEVGGAKTTFIGPKVKFTDSKHTGAVEVVEYEYAEEGNIEISDDPNIDSNGEFLQPNNEGMNVSMPPI